MRGAGKLYIILWMLASCGSLLVAEKDQRRILTVQDLLRLKPPPAEAVIPYAEGPYRFGQLRLPKGNGPFPVVIVIHGGCWLAAYDLQHISPLAAEITKLGYATWSLEYRRVGNPGGGWPGTFEDIAAGVDHLRNLSGQYKLDLDRVLTLGHSAGGHLALWAAARPRLPAASPLFRADPIPIQGVVSLAGAGDLTRPEFQQLCNQAVQKLMGGSAAEVPERYAQGSPGEMLPLGVPQILIQGTRDTIISLASGQDYLAMAKKKGDVCSLVVLPEAGHYELVIPASFAWPKIRAAVQELLKDTE
jgi:acetyl esterase/lipase